jgi:hypothetical protein
MKLFLGLTILGGFLCGQELPDGPGKQQVEQLCTGCHGLQPVVAVRRTKAEWNAEVQSMVGLGMQGSDSDLNAVVDYLSRHYGKGTLNWSASNAGAGALFLAGVLLLRGWWRLRRNEKPG